jgi:hypothetical protein
MGVFADWPVIAVIGACLVCGFVLLFAAGLCAAAKQGDALRLEGTGASGTKGVRGRAADRR